MHHAANKCRSGSGGEAPTASAAAATAASRAAVASSIVSVRSGGPEAQREGQRLHLRPEPFGVDVDVEQAGRSSSNSPAPARSASSTSDAATRSPHDQSHVEQDRREGRQRRRRCPAAGSVHASRSSSMAHVRSGNPRAATTRGCSSPAWPTTVAPMRSSAHRPGCQGAVDRRPRTQFGAGGAARRPGRPRRRRPSLLAGPGPHHPGRSASPQSRTATCRGCAGMAA